MSDSDLIEGLALLGEILDRKVALLDPSGLVDETHEAAVTETEEEPRWETWQTKDCPSTSVRHATSPNQEAPFIGVDVDCSRLVQTREASGDVNFCPWKTILAYPNMFIGKANKPRICWQVPGQAFMS